MGRRRLGLLGIVGLWACNADGGASTIGVVPAESSDPWTDGDTTSEGTDSSTAASGPGPTGEASSTDPADDTGGPGLLLDVGPGETDTGPDPAACPCGQNADLVYVLSDDAELWTYDPATNAFARLGSFSCDAGPLSGTFSMGVARSGVAWVMYMPGGDIFHVDVNDANSCSDPGYTPGQNGFTLFGMAFVSDSVDDPCDALYAHSFSGSIAGFSEGFDSGRLGRLDENLSPQFIADIDYDGGELTGTADGRLFAFAGENPAKLIEYDKDTGAVLETTPLDGLELTNAFAFAFWGGDFYFFTEGDSGGGGPFSSPDSKVTKLDHDGDGQLSTVNDSAPLRVVGAGVSTCAPLVPPG